ncbi:hypothetical protein OG948_55800 (plasmid) [Embleya sp. NBC_00888]|uniref:hypothetical protein n=1 Tax=Embleya sp. NBC_00888 TaxID=2975960 RepID=UPI002F913DAE|nr:hypothetical protein OG948_55800 [Embleya sp. NBC_00888]
MSYRVRYRNAVEDGPAKPSAARQTEVRSAATRTTGHDPYEHGSSSVHGDRDRRDVSLARVITHHEADPGVLVVIIVRAVAPFGRTPALHSTPRARHPGVFASFE